MPTGGSQRLRSEAIKANRKALSGIQSLEDYAPRNSAYSVDRLEVLHQQMEAAQKEEERMVATLVATRTAAIEAERTFHEAMLGAKSEVITQYGADSSAVQRLGLKRKSERRRPTRRANGVS